MSNSRHGSEEPAVRGYSVTHPPGAALLPSDPGWNQLLYTATGRDDDLGAGRVVDHPAASARCGCPTRPAPPCPIVLRWGFAASISPCRLRALPDVPRAVTLPRFCRELLLHAVRCCPLDLDDPVDSALLTVLVDQLRQLPDAPLWLAAPTDPRAVEFAAAATDDPGAGSEMLARRVNASRRTLERVFRAETGQSLGSWRRRANILGFAGSTCCGRNGDGRGDLGRILDSVGVCRGLQTGAWHHTP